LGFLSNVHNTQIRKTQHEPHEEEVLHIVSDGKIFVRKGKRLSQTITVYTTPHVGMLKKQNFSTLREMTQTTSR